MTQTSIPALMAPPPARPHPLTRSVAGIIGLAVLGVMFAACVLTMPWTLGQTWQGSPRYDLQLRTARELPPSWWPVARESGEDTTAHRIEATNQWEALEAIARARGDTSAAALEAQGVKPSARQVARAAPFFWMGTDVLGRSVLVRCLAGGGISLTIGLSAALLSVVLGTLYGAVAGYVGGRTDAVMMRIVDILFGLPYILMVVLLAVAVDAGVGRWEAARAADAQAQREAYIQAKTAELSQSVQGQTPEIFEKTLQGIRERAMDRFGSGEIPAWEEQAIGVLTLLIAIGGVSWLTMARVVRGQVLSLKAQPFLEAARAMGVGVRGQFGRHLLPNLVGPIVVYATLTVPQAILQESFLSFLGIGVKPPLPSWGNLAADGLGELNPYKSHWWLLVFPCLLLGVTLLALNFVGEGLREALDPKRSRR